MPIAVDKSGAVVYLTDNGEWKPAQTARNPKTNETSAFDGKGWVSVVPPSRSAGELVGDVGRSLASGMTFGFADELAAAADTAFGTGKPTYEENLAAQQARNKEIPLQLKIPGEVAGAVAGTILGAPIRAPMAAATGISKLPQWVQNIGAGGAGGALFGAGDAEPGQRVEGAMKGGAIGLAAGTVVPPVVNAIAGTANAVRGAVMPQANVSADLGRAIVRDKTTPDALLTEANRLAGVRPGVSTFADAGGENIKGLVERIAQTPGAGRTKVVPFLTDRQQGQLGRIAVDLRQLTGTQKTATQAIGETMEQRSKDAKPIYDEAFDFNAREVPEIEQAWQQETLTGYGRSFLLKPDFRKTLQTEYGIQNPADAPLMVQIDAWKKVADDFIGENIGTNKARVVQGMRQRVLDVVDQHNPKYAEARNTWAGPSEYMEAIKEGQNILSTKIDGEQLTAGLGAMTQAQQEAYRIGAVSAMISKMGMDPAKMGDMTKYLRSPEMRAKVAAIMPTPEARATWAERLDFEVSASELTGRALGNSATARRLAEGKDADSIVGDLVMDAFAGTPPIGLLRRAISAIPNKVRDTLRSRSDDILAELLTDQQSMQGLIKALERVNARSAAPSTRGQMSSINAANAGVIPQR